MGHNLDLCWLMGAPDETQCPKCREDCRLFFDDFDIDCIHMQNGEGPGEKRIRIGFECTNCRHDAIKWLHVKSALLDAKEAPGEEVPRAPPKAPSVFHNTLTAALKDSATTEGSWNEFQQVFIDLAAVLIECGAEVQTQLSNPRSLDVIQLTPVSMRWGLRAHSDMHVCSIETYPGETQRKGVSSVEELQMFILEVLRINQGGVLLRTLLAAKARA